ncbi:MAG: DNA polymerase III subunit delta [Acaryochloridaceae cyanobacterium CSU_5_19]|nr:DNA polymerase III subunit delta [Acaryochloridaceae cyanobacterium CSU_5_19]
MPIYFYWGEDTYQLNQAVNALHQKLLDPAWQSFNSDKIDLAASGASTESLLQGLNQALTPPFGRGQRLIWLLNPLTGGAAQAVFTELERTIAALPETSHLLLTQANKPDGRSKITKLLQKKAQVREFGLIPPWQTAEILQRVKRIAHERGVKLTPAALEQFAEAIGNDTRRLYGELEKLQVYALNRLGKNDSEVIDIEVVRQLIPSTTQNSLQLADAIRQGQTDIALALVAELLNLNEPGLKITATLARQFRTWLWVKLMLESGEQDERAIAQAAEVNNPKRIYFIKQAVQRITPLQLRQSLACLLDLDVKLKQGDEERSTLLTQVIKISQICRPG